MTNTTTGQPDDAAGPTEEDPRITIARLRRALARERAAREAAEDIAERTTTRLYRALGHLEEQHASLRSLSAAAAHDVRNPLASLSGFVQLLQMDDIDDATRAMIVDRLSTTTAYTAQLMDGLFQVLRSGITEEAATSFPLGPLLEDLVAELAGRHPDVRVGVAVTGTVWARRRELHRLFDNLLENAARYAGPTATVVVEDRVDGSDLLVTVADDGPGVAPHDASRIFEIYKRGADQTDGVGSGIGLSVCRRIARAAGGDVQLEDSPSALGGAAFTVRLPITREAAASG